MRFRFAVLVAVTSFLTVLSPAHAAPRPTAIHTAAIDSAYVQRMMFGLSLRDFLFNASVGDSWFDWSTDYTGTDAMFDSCECVPGGAR